MGVQVGWGGDSVGVGVGDSALHVMRAAVITPVVARAVAGRSRSTATGLAEDWVLGTMSYMC